jgi:hypothetical protein
MKITAATMREVAQKARVSTSTVSLALRNSALVAEETRTRIRKLAAELGYRIHPLVAAHMRSRRKPHAGVSAPVIALIDAQRVRHGWQDHANTMMRAMFTGAVAQARRRGYQTQSFWLHEPGMSQARFSEILRARGIHGVVIGPSSELQLTLNLQWECFSVVRLGSAHVSPMVHRVVVDHYQASILAIQKAYDLGYRQPGLTLKEPFSVAHEHRYQAGFTMACAHAPAMRPVPTLLTQGVPDGPTLLRWVRRYRPDVIVDAEERHVYDLLRAAGWRVPQDMGVLSLCAPSSAGLLGGCVQDGSNVGSAGVDHLIAMIERNETGVPTTPMTLSSAVTWNQGKTVVPSPNRTSAEESPALA